MSNPDYFPNRTMRGPWRSSYRVNLITIATNVAQRARRAFSDGDWWRETPGAEDIHRAVVAAIGTLHAYDVDGSINGFWGARIRELDKCQTLAVIAEACRLTMHADLYEMFDGQY